MVVGDTEHEDEECLIVGVYDLEYCGTDWRHHGELRVVEMSGLRDSEVEHLGYSGQGDLD